MFIACGSAWRADPRLVQAQVHPPARAARPRGWRSDSRLRRGSFALRMGRSPMRKPHVPCVWNRLAGRPQATADPRLQELWVTRGSTRGPDGTN